MLEKILENKIKSVEIVAIILLYAFLLYSILSTSFADDLGFDFAGYAVRYNNAFSEWFPNHHFGLPTSTLDGFVPALIPLFFKFLGFGTFTFPLILAILLVKALIPLAFIPLGKLFRQRKTTSVLLGLFFILNPVIFRFLNRYYELASWLFFILFFTCFYLLVKSEKFDKKFFVLSGIFATLAVLSHLTAGFFIALTAILFVTKINFKKISALAIFSGGLSAFWLIPFWAFFEYGGIGGISGLSLETQGITASSILLIAIIAGLLFFVSKIRKNYPIEFRFLAGTGIIAVLQFLLPSLPIIRMPFAHSYHVFFLISIIFALFILFKEKILQPKHVIAICIVLGIAGMVFVPKISGQYSFVEPTLSNYELNGEKIDFTKVDSKLKEIPQNERFEVMPRDIVINAYAAEKYNLSTADGWGYNAFALKGSVAKIGSISSMALECSEFNEISQKLGISKWLALTSNAFYYLQKCNWKSPEKNAPAIFDSKNKISIIENGEILEFQSKYVKIRAFPSETLFKENYFPRWQAYSGGKKIQLESKDGFMVIKTAKEEIVELKYEKNWADYLGMIVSIIAVGILVFICSKKQENSAC